MKKVFLAWQDSQSRHWFPIGKLTFDGENYHFVYIYGVKKAQAESNFKLLRSFPERDRIYKSSELFPLFSNRLMRSSRPDYQDYIQWLNIPQNEDDPIAILARSGGRKATDTFEIFPCPEKNENGVYHLHFFVHGLRYMPECSIEKVKQLELKERLYLTRDFQNTYDSNALLLRTKERHNLGYCPRYLAADIIEVLTQNPQLIEVRVERINFAPTPIQFRLLCNMTAQWNHNFVPFSSQDYQPIVDCSSVVKV
ncbi:MAG: HIRAN domain-containing protein [Pleurocapsa sp. MO_192.B19]|nr:HIRAN domain-containing protein [Pleurocapsa sp. MO_192.B19]